MPVAPPSFTQLRGVELQVSRAFAQSAWRAHDTGALKREFHDSVCESD
jgi:hypothetical protein